MALKGSLKDFSLPDLFQLLNFSKKNGTLNLLRGNARGYVCFRNGEVFFATTNWKRKPLGVKLLQVGIVTKAQVDEALELQRTTARGQRLGQLLIRLGYLTKDKLELFVQEQIQDAVFELLRWTEGEFEFQPGVVFPEEDIGLSISTEELIMEGSRRLDEWNRIEKKIPDLDVIFKMKSMNERLAAQISLTPEEWMVLTFVDGERTVKDIVDTAGMGTLQTCKIIYGLITSGLLENVSPDKTDAKVEQELERMAEELMQLEEKAVEKPATQAEEPATTVEEEPVPLMEEPAPIVEREPEVDMAAVEAPEAEEEEEAPPARPAREVSKTTLLEQVQELMVEVGAPVPEKAEPEPVAAAEEEAAETVEEEAAEEPPAPERAVAAEPEEAVMEAMEVEIGEDLEGEILIEEIPADEEVIGVEEAGEVEGIEEISEEVAEDVLAEEEEQKVEAAAAGEPALEPPVIAEEPVVELEDLVAEAAEQVVDFGALEATVDVTAVTGQEAPESLGEVEMLEAEMLSDMPETEAETTAGEKKKMGEIPLEGLIDMPGVGREMREEMEAEAASMVEEMRGTTLEESEEAIAEIELGEKEEELNILKEKIISLLPEGMGLGDKEEEASGAETAPDKQQPPSYRHKSITDESIEAQAAKRAYLEKRYGKVGKLADLEALAELEPEEIPMEWSGHLDRISHRDEAGGRLVEELPSGGTEAGIQGGRGIDPTKILGAAFRGAEKGEEESESLYGENVVNLKRPTGSISIDKLVEELGPEAGESLRGRMEETDASVAMAERTSRDYGTGIIGGEEGVGEGLPRASGFTPARDPIEMLEEEMLEDLGEEEEQAEVAVAAAPEAAAGQAEKSTPAIDDTFLRIEELEMDMLEGVIEEDLIELEPEAEESAQLEEAAELVEEAMVPVEVGIAAAGAPPESPSIRELEDDMLVDYVAGEKLSAAAPAAEEAEVEEEAKEETVPVPKGLEGLEDDLAALEKELFSGEEVALEEDILTDIEEIEKSLAEEEMAEEAPEAAAVLEEPEPATPVLEAPSETEMMEQFMEAAEAEEAPERTVVFEEPELAAQQPPEIDMLEHLMGVPETVEEAPAPATPQAAEMDMLEHLLEAPEAPPEPPAPAEEVALSTGMDMLERGIEMPETVEEAPAPATQQAAEMDMLEHLLEAPEAPPEPPAPPVIEPEPVAPAAPAPAPETAVPPAAPAPAAVPRPVARPAASAPPPPSVKIPEVKEEAAPKTIGEPGAVEAMPQAEEAPVFEEAAPGGRKTYDTGSFSLERELAELTGAGIPEPTRKIKIPVKPGTPVKEGESSMQEMAKGKPVPKVKRDKTVTKGIIVRIIDGIKKL